MLKTFIFISLVVCVSLCYGACVNPLPNAVVPAGYCASIWASGLSTPRGITTASNGDVIVVERGQARLSLYYKNSGGTLTRVTLATATGLNHAVIIRGAYIYASSASTVFRWPYTAGTRTNLGTAQTVITGIPTGGHATRSLAFTSAGLLLVQVGSDANVDSTDARAGIRQFDITTIPKTFSSGAWFARGLRNEAGIRADSSGTVWGIENGMDNLNRADLGGDIHLGNPGEELNKFSTVGKFYGYPYCWSQYNLSTVTTPRGTQYGLAPFLTDGTHTDAWCQNTNNVVKPAYQLHPHTAPLDLLFYYGTSFPGYSGSLFVAQHGSWNSAPAVGYRVSRITFSGGNPVSDAPFLSYVGPGQTGSGWHRPVALTLLNDGGSDVLLVTSDSTGVIIAIRYSP